MGTEIGLTVAEWYTSMHRYVYDTKPDTEWLRSYNMLFQYILYTTFTIVYVTLEATAEKIVNE